MFYAALQRFDKDDGERWLGYARWLGRPDLQRVVTLDSMLCPPVVRIECDEDWQVVVCEDFMLDFFTDFEFVRRRASGLPRSLVVAAARDPSSADVASFSRPDFEFAGFDVVDTHCCASAILDCGGFPEVFSVSELSADTGLITSRERAFEIRDTLRRLYPDGDHTDCYVWAIWTYTGTA